MRLTLSFLVGACEASRNSCLMSAAPAPEEVAIFRATSRPQQPSHHKEVFLVDLPTTSYRKRGGTDFRPPRKLLYWENSACQWQREWPAESRFLRSVGRASVYFLFLFLLDLFLFHETNRTSARKTNIPRIILFLPIEYSKCCNRC